MSQTVEIDQIPFADLGPNSIVVLRMPEGFAFGGGDRSMVDSLTRSLRDKVHESVQVLILQHGMEVFTVPEEIMNRAGWFRREEST